MSFSERSSDSISYAQALYEAAYLEMERDPTVFVYGLGVDDPKGMYGSTLDLHKTFGPNRCFDTPLAEDAMTGLGVGAAMAGMRPIHVHQRMDFLLLCMNQLVNMAAKMGYMTDGAVNVPFVSRGIIGRSWGQGAQHSQAFHSYFMHVPGIRVVAPSTPHDAKGCMIASIRDNNPVVFMEHRMLYSNQGIVPREAYEVPFGKARVLTTGNDVTIVAVSHMVVEAIRARHLLSEVGIEAEVIDPVSLSPLDIDTILTSVRKTKKLVVVDTSWLPCGVGSEIICRVLEEAGDDFRFQAKRLGYEPTPCPTTRTLEDLYYPSSGTIAQEVYKLSGGTDDWCPKFQVASEIEEFRGPF